MIDELICLMHAFRWSCIIGCLFTLFSVIVYPSKDESPLWAFAVIPLWPSIIAMWCMDGGIRRLYTVLDNTSVTFIIDCNFLIGYAASKTQLTFFLGPFSITFGVKHD